ncbi:MAG: ABC transporter permease subunit [Anaerolineales bacterium]|nr:ABC transporter permease subunit [Anaerolineales bacterium]
MRNIWIIAWKEFRQYFGSPIAYFLAVVIFLFLGIVFSLDLVQTLNNTYSAQELAGTTVLGPLLTLLLFATPAITMKLLAEENGAGTLELLLTAPVRDSELVVGKWVGAAMFASVILALTWVYPIFLQAITKPNGIDQGPLVSSYIVLFLLVGALLAIGVAVSSLFANATAAFFASLVVSLGLWVSGLATSTLSYMGGMGGTSLWGTVLQYLDFTSHFYNTAYAGRLDLTDIVYYLSLIALSLFFATRVIESKRWR